jgi:hypothetical protein
MKFQTEMVKLATEISVNIIDHLIFDLLIRFDSFAAGYVPW